MTGTGILYEVNVVRKWKCERCGCSGVVRLQTGKIGHNQALETLFTAHEERCKKLEKWCVFDWEKVKLVR